MCFMFQFFSCIALCDRLVNVFMFQFCSCIALCDRLVNVFYVPVLFLYCFM